MKIAGIPITQWLLKPTGGLTGPVTRWMQSLVDAVNVAAQQVAGVAGSAQAASVSATAFPASTDLPTGLYRVTYAMWLTQAATVSSSLAFTATWTNNGQTFTQSGAALTANTITSQQNGMFTFNIDASTSVLYQLAYASVGATEMQYSYDVRLEQLP